MNGAGRRLEEMAQQGLQMEEDGAAGEHMKAMWAGQSNVLVSVRVRPLMKHDVVKKSCVRVLDSKVVVIMDPASGDKQDVLRANRNREKQYAFDYVFEQGSSQDSCYHHTTKFLIHGVLDGFNATVFAYGQTGSGKTYTMVGTPADPGIMVRVMGDLFVHSVTQGKQQGVHYKVTVSFLEVYNENIRDLLSDVEEYLDLREDPIKGPVVASITEIETTSSAEIMQLLLQGNAKRSQAATAANEVSSRSHAVLQVVVESRDRAPGTVANIKVGKLSLVDLAGSERAANTKNVGARLVEGANINRSLLALGNCINALGEKGNKGNFVPYRDSKLTRLLKDSLGGNCRTVMIANISSAESSFEETLNTLKYANRAKNIKTHVQRNVLNVNYHISEYVQLIDNLRSEIQLLKGQIGSTPAPDLSPPTPSRNNPSTPFHVLRESMRTATASLNGNIGGEGRELVNNMRQRIVENFQERMQLRRSLIELEDQNVQNSIEVSKRQLIVVQWSETNGNINKKNKNGVIPNLTKADFAADILANGTGDIVEAWQECEQLRKAIMKNNGMKKNIAKRLRHNEREAEKFRDELGDKITGEDRRELMELQYQVGRLELENMELEQHRIVHESILKGKDLVIQKLKLQLAVRDKLIQRQQVVLQEHDLDDKVGYSQLALLEQTLMGDSEFNATMAPPSPPRNMSEMHGMPSHDLTLHSIDSHVESGRPHAHNSHHHNSHHNMSHNVPRLSMPSEQSTLDLDGGDDDEVDAYGYGGYEVVPVTERGERGGEVALSARDRDIIEQGDWSEINNELTDNSFGMGKSASPSNGGMSKNNNHHRISNPINRNNSNANSNASLAGNVIPASNVGGGGNKAIHGPRGGRQFRSAATDDIVDMPAPSLGGVKQSSSFKQPQQAAFRNNNRDRQSNSNLDNFVVEDSDNDSERSRNLRNNAKKATPRSHRQGGGTSQDKLDPIPLVPVNHDEGLLSGRRYENSNAQHKGKHHHGGERDDGRNRDRDQSPRGNRGGYDSNNEAPPAGGYAPIYPSLFNKGEKDGAKGAGRGSNANQQQPYRRNSRDRMDEEAQQVVDSQLNDLNIGGRGMGGKQGGSNAKNNALGRLKVKGNISNSNLQVDSSSGPSGGLSRNNGGVLSAAEIAPLNAPSAANNGGDFSLNVNGSGFNGNQPSGQNLAPLGANNVGAGAAGSGARSKLKPSRKLIQKSINAGGGDSGNEYGNLSIDGVGGDAEQLSSHRNKSLPNLPKQLNAAPNSARGV